MKTYFICLIVAFLGGCAKNNLDYQRLLYSKDSRVETFRSLHIDKLEKNKECKVDLGGEHRDIILLKNQRVFAAKLSLPKMEKPFSIEIYSQSSTGFFAPKVYFLDKNNKIIDTLGAKNLTFDRGLIKGTKFINNRYRQVAYIVVTQDVEAAQDKHNIVYVQADPIPIMVGSYMFTYMDSSSDQNKTLTSSKGGEVSIVIREYSPQQI